MADDARVLVAGAGPAGLVTALCLARRGVPVTVLEAEPDLAEDLRAGTFHPPTLEMLDDLGVTADLQALGLIARTWQFRDREAGVVAEFDLDVLRADTPYPYRLHCEQFKMARVVYERLVALPHARVAFDARVTDVAQSADHVHVTVETPDGPRVERGAWLVGADGGRSVVRKAAGIEFEGFTWPEAFMVVSTPYDLGRHGFAHAAYVSDPERWCAVFKVPGDGGTGLWRAASPTDAALPDEVALADARVQERLDWVLPGQGPYAIVHRRSYRVHQRVAATLRAGRVLLVGDAAHVNNPLGGMGLNSGVHDGVTLAETLARVWRGEGDAARLDAWAAERRAINIEYVQSITIQNKRTIEERDPAVRRERHAEMRRIAEDPARARAYLLRTSMLASLRGAGTP
jgi:3-(3-hydroxy-phenyl)propionate hydroxylase